jgi:hypothetical protein
MGMRIHRGEPGHMHLPRIAVQALLAWVQAHGVTPPPVITFDSTLAFSGRLYLCGDWDHLGMSLEAWLCAEE